MKQPELGRKIFALRTEKGLTQEELVEKCHISVRTIQRIESGEVSPRSYTVKSILVALDYDLHTLSAEKPSGVEPLVSADNRFTIMDVEVEKPSNGLIKQLTTAWIFGILYFGVGFFESASEYFLVKENELIFSKGVYIAIKVVSFISFVFFQRGFILIGGLFRNYLLKIISFIMIITLLIINVYDIISIFNDSVERVFIAGASALTFGCVGIIFGVSLLKLKGSVGRIATYAGWLELIGGCFLLTIVFAFVGLIIYIPAELLEIILIFKVIEIIKNKSTKTSGISYQKQPQ